MNMNGEAMDSFFLAHATERARQAFLPAGISIKNLAETFKVLAEREPIPRGLRDRYGQVAGILAVLKVAMDEAEDQMSRILKEAEDELPKLASVPEPDQALRESVLRVGRALDNAESMAWAFLRKAQLEFKGDRDWDEDKVHTVAKFCLQVDPGPDFQHYWLEGTDFNLFELPIATLDVRGEEAPFQEAWTFEPGSRMGPAAELTPHGKWLHGVLSFTCMRWELLPMVRTIYVDFDLGTGFSVPNAPGNPV